MRYLAPVLAFLGFLSAQTLAQRLVSEDAPFSGLSQPQKQLMVGIRDGRTNIVHQLLLDGLDPNFTVGRGPDCGTTPLIEAVADERSDIISLLLARDADVNLGSPHCGGALSVAAWNGDDQVVATLIQRGAEVDVRDGDSATPLLVAASNAPGLKTIDRLIAAGADVHALDAAGNNALMLSAWNLNEDAVALFLKLGLDPCAKNKRSETAEAQVKRLLHQNEQKKQRILRMLRFACARHSVVSDGSDQTTH